MPLNSFALTIFYWTEEIRMALSCSSLGFRNTLEDVEGVRDGPVNPVM